MVQKTKTPKRLSTNDFLYFSLGTIESCVFAGINFQCLKTNAGTTIEMGRGVIDTPKVLKTLMDVNYQGAVSLEFDKDEEDPLPGVAESIGYIRGVLSVI